VFTWAFNFFCFYFGKSIITHVASSKEECLNRLLEYDLVPDGLPVGLGGSWTGGCEPWRKGGGHPNSRDDELSLEIETDLSCLFRTVLWTHEQAQQQQEQQQALVPAAAIAVPLRRDPVLQQQARHQANNTSCVSTAVAVGSTRGDEVEECGARVGTRRRRGRGAHHPAAAKKCSNVMAAPPETYAKNDDDPAADDDEAKKRARRRQMHTEADRARRARGRIEVEVLQEQVLTMTSRNQSLKEEQQRLQGLVQAATDMIIHS
jgi:hypothetical protein